jgi:hypothetical protein
MKYLLSIFILSIIFSCGDSTKTHSEEVDYNKTIDSVINCRKAEELLPSKTFSSDIGKVKTNGDGSIGSKTEMTELLRLLKNKDYQVIEIVFVQKSPPDRNYDDMVLKIVYNRICHTLKNIFVETNVIEEYKNINEECLKQFLKSGKKDFSYLKDFCKDSKYDFNNREMAQTAIGDKPLQSELDASVKVVEDYIKSNAKNASSIDIIEWSKVSEFGKNWIVRCKYKGANSFGAIVTENVWFYIQNNEVVETKTIF